MKESPLTQSKATQHCRKNSLTKKKLLKQISNSRKLDISATNDENGFMWADITHAVQNIELEGIW